MNLSDGDTAEMHVYGFLSSNVFGGEVCCRQEHTLQRFVHTTLFYFILTHPVPTPKCAKWALRCIKDWIDVKVAL